MLISLNWLQQYIPTIDQVDAEEVADKLSNSLAEVEQIMTVGEEVNNIVIGEVLSAEPHPKSENLQICQVKTDVNETRQIIHGGGLKVEVGDKVPVCLPGGTVLDPTGKFGAQSTLKIIEKEIKGVNSQGILCSLKELGLTDEHKEVMTIYVNSKVGEKLDVFLKDKILEIENKSLTHRPDCFSHLGIARELAALYNLKVEKTVDLAQIAPGEETLELQVEQKAQERNPRFTAIAIKNTKIGPSPFWMQALLAIIGIRPINNIVDISNYIMLDIGQPTHTFDYDKINGHKIIVKFAKDGDKITTLDGQTRKLTNKMAVLADTKEIIGLPGIMGAANTEVSAKTQNVVLVAENWEMFALRRASRDLGLRTEASTRFEKGLDPTKLTDILQIGADMITDLAGAEVASEIIDLYPKPEEPVKIEFDLNSVYKILGVELTKEEIINILEGLEIKVIGDEKIEENVLTQVDDTNKISLEIPSHRRDLKIKEDIIEEIARIYGYHKLNPTLPTKDLTPTKTNPTRAKIRKLKSLLSKYGIDEIYSYSMIGEKLADLAKLDIKQCIKIKNPLSPELGYYRNSLTASLLEKMELNIRNRFDHFACYELSRVAYKHKKNEDSLPYQPLHLGITAYSSKENTYKILKGHLDALFSDLNIQDLTIEKLDNEGLGHFPKAFHPVQTAKILYKGAPVGIIGNVHPIVKQNFEITGYLSLLEIEIEQIVNDLDTSATKYSPIPNLPAVYRDLSLWLKTSHEAGKILDTIRQSEIEYLERTELMDIYEDSRKQDQKSITLSLTFRSNTKTLQEKEVDASVKELISLLEKNFQAKMRR